MNDLIRRDDVIQAIHGYWGFKTNELPTENTEDGEIITDVRKANEYLEHNKQLSLLIQLIKAVEVTKPKTGHWISDGWDARCSECDWWADDDMTSNYCPNCGAKMDKE